MNRKMYLVLVSALACPLSLLAQTGMSSDSSMNKDHMMGKKMSMMGCIAEKDGKYMMMNKEHPAGVELMSDEDLKPHVGHKVKVTGMMEKMDAMSGDSMKSDEKKHDSMGMMEMKVSSMKMMSEHCDMGKMMDK